MGCFVIGFGVNYYFDFIKAIIVTILLLIFSVYQLYMNTCSWTPLQYACIKNNFLIVKYLLEFGADRKIKDHKGRTAKTLSYLVENNTYDAAKKMMENEKKERELKMMEKHLESINQRN